MAIPTVNGSIHSAQRMLEYIQHEAPIAEMIRNGDKRVSSFNAFDRQNILRSQLIGAAWRKIGRQVLAMHPEVVEEVRVSTSDKIPTEILQVLPYINPMVVFSDPPVFKSWMPGNESYHGKVEAAHRLLGFFTCGTGQAAVENSEGQLVGIEQRIYATTDTTAEAFTILLVFDILDEYDNVIDHELTTISLRYNESGTLADMVDSIMKRFHWYSERTQIMPKAPDKSDRIHRKWMREVLGVVVGSLFYLCSTTLEAESVPSQYVAKRIPKKVVRTPLSFYKVGWTTGAALTRYRQSRTPSTSEQADITHQQDPQHRRAHFKMQPYGPGKSLRKLIFVSAYWTHVERLGEAGMNTARRVPRANGKGDARESLNTVLGMSALPVEVK